MVRLRDRVVNAEVSVRDGEDVERLLRRFRRQVKKCGVLEEVREREYFEKPSVKRHRDKMLRKFRVNAKKSED